MYIDIIFLRLEPTPSSHNLSFDFYNLIVSLIYKSAKCVGICEVGVWVQQSNIRVLTAVCINDGTRRGFSSNQEILEIGRNLGPPDCKLYYISLRDTLSI